MVKRFTESSSIEIITISMTLSTFSPSRVSSHLIIDLIRTKASSSWTYSVIITSQRLINHSSERAWGGFIFTTMAGYSWLYRVVIVQSEYMFSSVIVDIVGFFLIVFCERPLNHIIFQLHVFIEKNIPAIITSHWVHFYSLPCFLHRLNLIAHCSSFTSSSPFVWHVQSHGRAASSAKCRSLSAFFDMWNALLAHSVRGEEMWTRHLTRHTQVALERGKMLDTCKNENVNWLENVDNSHCHCTPFALVSLIDIGDIWLYFTA